MKRPLLCITLFALSLPALAVDGVIEINHARALAGGITPGDTPGYPVTLSQSGSYRLTGNLTQADPNTPVIQGSANDVTLDLNGFTIGGTNACSYALGVVTCAANGLGPGILLSGSRNTVFNGDIVGIGAHGIFISGAGGTVENVRISDSGSSGVYATATGAVIRNNSVRLVQGTGIVANDSARIVGNTVTEVGVRSVFVEGASLISGNVLHTYNNTVIECSNVAGYGNNIVHRSEAGAKVGVSCQDMGGNLLP